MSNFGFYIFCIIAFIVAFFLLKKVAGCLLKTLIFAVIIGVLAAIYFLVIHN